MTFLGLFQDSSSNIIFSDQKTGNKAVDSEGTLEISNFGIPDIGKYKCVGDNGHGQLSAKIEIKLKGEAFLTKKTCHLS